MAFIDRSDAGRQLAAQLARYRGRGDVLVLALPRGGVPVGFEVAMALAAPLDVFLVRKLGVPGHEELAMGAIATGEVLVLNDDVIREMDIPESVIHAVAEQERAELLRREQLYRDDRPVPQVQGRTCILVDDGLATGASMHSAVDGLRKQQPAGVVIAVPVAAAPTAQRLQTLVEDFVAVEIRDPFFGVGYWYEDFSQTTDDEVRSLLAEAHHRYATSSSA